jgi:methylase of polypeptide subunit release factors
VHARLVEEAPGALRPGGWLVMEVAAGQAARVVEMLKHPMIYEDVLVRKDGLGWERVVAARLHREPASALNASETCAQPTTA